MRKRDSFLMIAVAYVIVVILFYIFIVVFTIKSCREVKKVGLKTIASDIWEGTTDEKR